MCLRTLREESDAGAMCGKLAAPRGGAQANLCGDEDLAEGDPPGGLNGALYVYGVVPPVVGVGIVTLIMFVSAGPAALKKPR